MDYISNIFTYLYNAFNRTIINVPILDEPILDEPIIVDHINKPIINQPIIEPTNELIYIFINTANIYNATEMMIKRLKTYDYNNKYIKVYLLKSHTLKPLFKKQLMVTDYNLELIERRLSKQRRHLHTFIDAIDSYIEYNNIRNYNIYY